MLFSPRTRKGDQSLFFLAMEFFSSGLQSRLVPELVSKLSTHRTVVQLLSSSTLRCGVPRRNSDFHAVPAKSHSHGQPQEFNATSMATPIQESSNIHVDTAVFSRSSLSVPESAAESPAIVFTSAISNTNYTKADLEAWARGKKNPNGDLVFFKPGFISEDPWSRLRDRSENHG